MSSSTFAPSASAEPPPDSQLDQENGSSSLPDGQDADEFRSRGSKKIVRQLNISNDLVKGWSTKDAFRELFQNWRTAIAKSFPSVETFSPEYQDNAYIIRVKVPLPSHDPRTPEYIGFIHFSRKSGTLVIANANAKLQPRHLQLGHDRDCQIGRYGEGLKLAIVVMIRAGYKVRIEASDHSWNFSSSGTSNAEYLCTIHPSRKKVNSSGNDTDAMPTLGNRIGKDVAVIIETGKLQSDEFRDWLRTALGIRGLSKPKDVVRTRHGDLILDTEYSSHTYVRGLSCQIKEDLHYGYNFHNAGICRGPPYLIDNSNQPELLCRLWEAAIQKRSQVLPLYVDMLRDPQEPLDVREADKFLDKDTAQKIWNYLLLQAKGDLFYYSSEKAEDILIIKDCLKKDPVLIPDTLWNLLRNAKLIRTPKEEQVEKFKTAKKTSPPDSVFSKTLQRMIVESTLMLNQEAKDIIVLFVDSTDSSIQAHFDPHSNVLNIRGTWLCFHSIHAEYPCMMYQGNPDMEAESFACDHIFALLFEIVIKELNRDRTDSRYLTWESKPVVRIRERALQMPRDITIKAGIAANQLVVSWSSGMSQQALMKLESCLTYHVVLHDKQCVNKAHRAVHDEVNMGDNMLCDCAQQIVTQSNFVAAFDGLDPSKAYFPMVAWNDSDSLYGLPPDPIKPSAVPAPKPREPSESSESSEESTSHEQDVMVIDKQAEESSVADEHNWKQWEEEMFPKVFDSLTPSYESGTAEQARLLPVYESLRLNWRFEKDDYAIVMMRFPNSFGKQSSFILYTHGIQPPMKSDEEDDGILLATLFSFSGRKSVFQPGNGQSLQLDTDQRGWLPRLKDCELILHFKEFDSMGSWYDASRIPIQWIDAVHPISSELFDTLQYTTTEVSQEPIQSGLFCRFAHRCDGPDDTACFTPVASHLLPRSKRWAKPRYSSKINPVVLDLSPGVVGVAEGFRQCGFEIYAGVGFNPAFNLTWKTAHGSAAILDGTLNGVISDIKSDRLNPLQQIPPGTPCIATLCIADMHVSDRREKMRKELEALDCLRDILTLQPQLDFLALILPPWILHEDAYDRLFQGIYDLLASRYCIHLKKVSLASHGIPCDGTVIILLASSVSSPVQWTGLFDSKKDEAVDPIAFDRIRDLAFRNPRSSDLTAGSLVCKHPTANTNVYNHQTGIAPPDSHPVDLGSLLDMTNTARIRHPERKDILTVRELARIQGFSDDFVFLGSTQQQYADVTRAFPPLLAKKLGLVILDLIRGFQTDIDVDGRIGVKEDEDIRGQKRRRLGDEW